MTSQPEKQVLAIHILPNISKSEGNQAMKFFEMKYLLKNHTQNVVVKLFPDPFLKNQN